ncbi:MAG: hypothetical protein WA197_08145 [Candidatus Acidiferrales bacterium]
MKSLFLKDAILNGTSKQINEVPFLYDQMDSVVTTVSILAEAKCLTNLSVLRENISLNPGLLVLAPIKDAHRALLDGDHFSHFLLQ